MLNTIIRYTYLSVCFLFISFNATAAPSFIDEHTAVQPGGYQFQVHKTKNSSPFVRETNIGHTIIFDHQRDQWVYAVLDSQNRLTTSPFVVGKDSPGNIPLHLFSEIIYNPTDSSGKKLANKNQAAFVGGSISGRVSNSEGIGISDVYIKVYMKLASRWDFVGLLRTSNDGSYIFGGLDTGVYRIGFEDTNKVYAPEFYDNAATLTDGADINVTLGEDTPNINAQLALGGSISGTITSPEGNGLSDIFVKVYQRIADRWNFSGLLRTDSDGAYTFGGLVTGEYRIEFEDTNKVYAPEYYNNAGSLADATDISVTLGKDTPNINVQLSLGGSISGKVTSPEGGGLSDIYIKVYEKATSRWSFVGLLRTNRDGSYTFGGLVTGVYRLEFEDTNKVYAPEFYDNADTLTDGNDINVALGKDTANINAQLAFGGSISGKVTNPEGAGISDVYVKVYQKTDSHWDFIGLLRTDRDGSYTFGGLDVGVYHVEFEDTNMVYAPEFYDNAATLPNGTDIQVVAGKDTPDINAQLAIGGSISGKVTNPEGSGISDVYVKVYQKTDSHWDFIGLLRTGRDGRYTFGGLVADVYYIEFEDTKNIYASEFYDNAENLTVATDITVMLGKDTPDVDAVLGDFPETTFTFDIDGNSQATPLTDGLLVLRYLFGFTDSALITNAVDTAATRTAASDIQAYLQTGIEDGVLDIDGNGQVKPLTDGLLVLRYLFGFSGDSLINNAIGTGATRIKTVDVEAYIQSKMP